MKEDIELLVRLQESDIQIKTIADQLKIGPERVKLVENQLEEIKEKLDVDENLKKEIQKKQRSYETEISDNNIRINKNHAKSSSIKTNKEYQALLNEIEEIKNRNSQIEDEILNCLMELDETDEIIKKSKQEKKKKEQIVIEEKEKVSLELDQLQKKYDLYKNNRLELEKAIAPDLLKRYNYLLNSCNGIAVSAVQDGSCNACNTSVRPQLIIELQKSGEFTYCPSCQRMLYWKASDNPENK